METVSEILPIIVVLVLVVVGELIFRRIPNAGGLFYNLSGTFAGVIWVLAGAFIIWGGGYLLGGIMVLIGVNIHRSNFKIASETLQNGRGALNG